MITTFFPDFAARTSTERDLSLEEIRDLVLATTAPTKAQLPWLKLCRFSDARTASGSLRHNANVISITGIEGDYDLEILGADEAAGMLFGASVNALIYTSPSHTPEKPRWRVLCPLAQDAPPEMRYELIGRLNHVLGGVLSTESFTLSQAYYLGRPIDGAPMETHIVAGRPIDTLDLPTRYPDRARTESLILPAAVVGQTPDERTTAVLNAALGAFEASQSRHDTIVATTLALAPYVLSGHLAAEDVVLRLTEACTASGREPNPGEVERALSGALPRAQRYVPATGEEFDELPPLPPADELPDAWRSMLQVTSGDTPKGNLFNACHAFRTAPAWRGVLRHDDLANRIEMVAPPPWHTGGLFLPRELTDVDVVRAATWLQEQGIQVKGPDARDALMDAADHAHYHPIRAYLDGLRWDGVSRIDGWLSDYLGASETPLNRAYAAKFLISMVARVRQPGCKVDTVLILEGRQGLRKSTALAVLAGVRWFTDHMPDLGSKDAMEQLQGKWLIEHAELDKLGKSEASRVKSFISTPIDRFRPPFGRVARDFPRQCVFAGTVNPGSVGYLQDETGNRRFWPAACGVGWGVSREADTAGLAAVRDQLWAEAQHRYAQGENHWLEGAALIAEQARSVAERMAVDVWHERVVGYLEDKPDCSIGEILSLAIGKPAAQQSHADNIRVGRILRTLGWESKHIRLDGGARERRYCAPLLG